jgi:hypothetical protein
VYKEPTEVLQKQGLKPKWAYQYYGLMLSLTGQKLGLCEPNLQLLPAAAKLNLPLKMQNLHCSFTTTLTHSIENTAKYQA